MENGKRKIVSTALDDLDYGNYTAENVAERGKNEKILRPEGISSRRMLRDVLIIAWPSLVELILTQLTSMADQIMVGRMPGTAGIIGLGAVGLSMQPKFLLMVLTQSLNVGTTAVIARFRGQQNQEKANQVFRQGLLLNVVLGILLAVLGITFAEPMVRFMSGKGVSAELLQASVDYLDINLYGFLPLALTFTITAALRGVGDSRTPLFYNSISNVVNLFFNYCLIYGHFGFPAMGVRGAALATVIGQTVAFVIAMIRVSGRRSYVYLSFKEKFRVDLGLLKSVVNIGIPSMIEQLFMRVGMLIFTRAVSGLGDTLYATHQICMNIQAMCFMLGQAFGNSTTTLMGQSLGKRRYDMAVLYMRETQKVGLLISLLMMGLMMTFSRQLVGLYNETPEVVAVGGQVLFVVAIGQPIQTAQFIVSGGMRGAGDTRFAAVVTAITVFAVRSLFVVLLVNTLHYGIWGAWAAIMIDSVVRTVLMLWRYSTGKWAVMGLATCGAPMGPGGGVKEKLADKAGANA